MDLSKKVNTTAFASLILYPMCWAHFGILVYYNEKANNTDCDFELYTFTQAIIAMYVVGLILLLSGICKILYVLSNESEMSNDFIFNCYEDYIKSMTLFLLFLSVSSILSIVVIFKSDILYNSTPCKSFNNNLLLYLVIISFSWLVISGILYVSFYLIYKWITILFILFKKSICYDCFSIKHAHVEISQNDKECQCDIQVAIPIQDINSDIKYMCILCQENKMEFLCDPCNHICMCNDCYDKLDKKICPCCRTPIANKKNIFFTTID